jgi:hypothetical protein
MLKRRMTRKWTAAEALAVIVVFGLAATTCSAQSVTLTSTHLSQARHSLSGTAVGTKVLFGGGNGIRPESQSFADRVDIYDSATNTWSVAKLSEARGYGAATSTGGKAFFAGGYTGYFGHSFHSNVVDIFDDATGVWSTATLSAARAELAAASLNGKALFAGGSNLSGGHEVDIYDTATGLWSTASLSLARGYMAATTVGNKESLRAVPGLATSCTIGSTSSTPRQTAGARRTCRSHAGNWRRPRCGTSRSSQADVAQGTSGTTPSIYITLKRIPGAWLTFRKPERAW